MNTAKAVLATIGVFILLIGTFLVLFFATNIFQQKTANFRGETSKREKVEADGSYRIAAYDHFFDTCSQVQSKEQSITNLDDELKGGASKQRTTVIKASISALKNSRAELINQYNADAAKDYTSGQFRDSKLPYRLDINDKETQCAL